MTPNQEAVKPHDPQDVAKQNKPLNREPLGSQSLVPTSFWQALCEMDAGFALLQSMARSKTLTIMVIIFVLAAVGFVWFLSKMAA